MPSDLRLLLETRLVFEIRPLLEEIRYTQYVYSSVIFVNENENENGEKRENNEFVNEN